MIKHDTKKPLITRPFQKIFITLAFITFLTQVYDAVRMILLAYPNGTGFNFSSYTVFALGLPLFPLVLFILAYVLGMRRNGRLLRTTVAILYTLLFVLIQTVLNIFYSTYIQVYFPYDNNLASILLQLAPTFITIILLLGTLYASHFKKSNKESSLDKLFLDLLASIYIAIAGEIIFSILQQVHNNSYDANSFIMYGALVVGTSLMAVIAYFKFTRRPSSFSHRLTKTLFYTLIPGLTLFVVSFCLMVVSYTTNKEQLVSVIPYGLLSVLATVIAYVLFLTYAQRKKIL
jgi:hypothetical protein